MDALLTTGEVAAALGTTRSRIHRVVSAGWVRPARTVGGHLRFTADDLGLLKHRLGFTPSVAGLSREEVLVAATLLLRPLGLRSARAVARVAGISPTTASRALMRLERTALVRRRRRQVVLGTVSEVEVWEINVRNPRWNRLGRMLGDVEFPESSVGRKRDDRRIPIRLRHLFWNADVGRLDLDRDAAYLAGRVLASDDAQAHAWAVSALPADAFLRAASIRGVEPRRAALARNLAIAR